MYRVILENEGAIHQPHNGIPPFADPRRTRNLWSSPLLHELVMSLLFHKVVFTPAADNGRQFTRNDKYTHELNTEEPPVSKNTDIFNP